MNLSGSSPALRLGAFGARLRPGAGGLLAWWGRSLAAWIPPRAQRVLGLDRGRLLLQVDGDGLQVRREQRGEVADVCRLPLPPAPDAERTAAPALPSDPLTAVLEPPLANLPRWLLLPAASGLRRRLQLPAAAADRVRDVVGFEVERQTPFARDAVAFDARVLGRHGDDGRIDAELVVVPRTELQPCLARLGPMASMLAGVDLADEAGRALGVNLLAPSERRRERDPWAPWNLALAALALAMLAALLWQLLDNRRQAGTALEARIATQADAGRRAAIERRQLTALVEGQAFLDQARAQRAPAVEVLDELTRRLPDETYLEKLSLDRNQLVLIGLSRDAAGLVGRLQGAEQWRSPALAGALQPDPASGRDRFTLTASVAPVAPAAAAVATREDADGAVAPSGN